MSLNYPVEVKKLSSEDGGGFYVSIPQLGKYAFHADGETLDKAFESLENVKEFLFEQYLKNGIPIHEPITINETEYSGKFVMRVPKQLHRILVNGAKKEGISLNQYVQFLLTSATVTKLIEDSAIFKMRGDGTVDLFQTYKVDARKPASKSRYIQIEVTFVIILESEFEFTEVFFEVYKEISLHLNTWPYLREFVNQATSRMNVPPLTLPLYKAG